jgi:hypothetical protein
MSLTLVPREGRPPPAPAAAPGAGPWVDAWWSAFAASWRYLETVSTAYDPRQLRTWWLADLGSLSLDYMRSSSFLSLMRFTLK